ncbi:MAG: hypothetical protein IMZ67_01925 [Acidobacteria bacterium]|nr:hypothetical protein [Acidobacteriota bacterium]
MTTAGQRAKHTRHGTEGCLDIWRGSEHRGRGKSPRSLALIKAARTILAEIQPATVRACCYRLFTMGLIASMAKGETNRVSTQLTWAREHGFVPWDWIVDETRAPERVDAFTDPQDYVEAVKRSYRKDRWTDQPERIEVWSEKGTINGILRPVLDAYGVTFRVMHGYGSATAVYQAAQDSQCDAKLLTVFYVGDHDPSGLHMSEADLPRRLKEYGGVVDLIRLALTKEDTRSGLPWFATETKRHDPRFRWYLERHGSRCWELDALSPVVLRDRVEEAIVERLDREAWQRAEITERAECESLATILNAWPGVARASSISGPASK